MSAMANTLCLCVQTYPRMGTPNAVTLPRTALSKYYGLLSLKEPRCRFGLANGGFLLPRLD